MKSAFSSIKIGKEAQEPAFLLADDAISQREKYLPKAVKVLGKSDGTRGKGHLWILSHHKWDNRKSVAPDCLRINFYYARPEKLVIFRRALRLLRVRVLHLQRAPGGNFPAPLTRFSVTPLRAPAN